MACLSSTVLACTLYSAQHRQQRRRRSVSCAISILYLATLARQGASHTENKENSDVLPLFIRKYIYQRYLLS